MFPGTMLRKAKGVMCFGAPEPLVDDSATVGQVDHGVVLSQEPRAVTEVAVCKGSQGPYETVEDAGNAIHNPAKTNNFAKIKDWTSRCVRSITTLGFRKSHRKQNAEEERDELVRQLVTDILTRLMEEGPTRPVPKAVDRDMRPLPSPAENDAVVVLSNHAATDN